LFSLTTDHYLPEQSGEQGLVVQASSSKSQTGPAGQASGEQVVPTAAITQGSGLSSHILPFGLRPQASLQ